MNRHGSRTFASGLRHVARRAWSFTSYGARAAWGWSVRRLESMSANGRLVLLLMLGLFMLLLLNTFANLATDLADRRAAATNATTTAVPWYLTTSSSSSSATSGSTSTGSTGSQVTTTGGAVASATTQLMPTTSVTGETTATDAASTSIAMSTGSATATPDDLTTGLATSDAVPTSGTTSSGTTSTGSLTSADATSSTGTSSSTTSGTTGTTTSSGTSSTGTSGTTSTGSSQAATPTTSTGTTGTVAPIAKRAVAPSTFEHVALLRPSAGHGRKDLNSLQADDDARFSVVLRLDCMDAEPLNYSFITDAVETLAVNFGALFVGSGVSVNWSRLAVRDPQVPWLATGIAGVPEASRASEQYASIAQSNAVMLLSDRQRTNLFRSLGGTDPPSPGFSRMFYLPPGLLREFARLARGFSAVNVPPEVALPTILRSLSSRCEVLHGLATSEACDMNPVDFCFTQGL
eukprot:TRINITY_DN4291_c0_g1_i2.p1 TRINITY_DN4291_c0_g1~~TRINITY_DN4291_c0_g1_i2.p1  ORF type:complete len:513 (-),score=102.88 TRINITY_DN4291_c0_g1_i2:151-1536(-)